jgi:hypothetical protein
VDRVVVLNTLIEARGYRRYLEIGCQADVCFSLVRAPDIKVGVDIASGGTLRMPSDEFFALASEPFDLIFIDGDHRHEQVFRDISNALRLLAPGGAIVMHDCLPPTPEHESPDLCGTAWRAFAKTRERHDLESFTCDFDFGVGVIRRHRNTTMVGIGRSMDQLTYADFVANRESWMRPHGPDAVMALLTMGAENW